MVVTENCRDVASLAELADPPVLSKKKVRQGIWGASSVTDIPGLPSLRPRLCIPIRAQSPHKTAPPAPLIGRRFGEPILAWHNGTQLRALALAKLIVYSILATNFVQMKQLSIPSGDGLREQGSILQHIVRDSGRVGSQAIRDC